MDRGAVARGTGMGAEWCGIMRIMMSGAVAGCQANRARSVALGVVTSGG